jgi:hypothetical protein
MLSRPFFLSHAGFKFKLVTTMIQRLGFAKSLAAKSLAAAGAAALPEGHGGAGEARGPGPGPGARRGLSLEAGGAN